MHLIFVASSNERDSNIIHICSCGARYDQTVYGLERVIGIVAGKNAGDSQIIFRQLAHGVAVDIAAGSIGGAVCTVAADAEDTGICYAGNAFRGRQRQLLISPAKTVPNDPHNGLASGNEGELFAVSCMGAHNIAQKSPGFLCLTVQ